MFKKLFRFIQPILKLPEDQSSTKGLIIIGAGGHAKVIIEIFREMGEKVDYCVGDLDSPDTCLGVTVLKGDEHLSNLYELGYKKVFVAIGDNFIRRRLADIAGHMGYHLINAISPNAVLSPSARLGKGIAIMSGTIVQADSVIEDLAIINTGATIDHDCQIGQAAHLAPQCVLAGNVIIGKAALLGIGCKVIPGMQIGQNATIGAGGVVISHIPDQTIAMGVPAKIVTKES